MDESREGIKWGHENPILVSFFKRDETYEGIQIKYICQVSFVHEDFGGLTIGDHVSDHKRVITWEENEFDILLHENQCHNHPFGRWRGGQGAHNIHS